MYKGHMDKTRVVGSMVGSGAGWGQGSWGGGRNDTLVKHREVLVRIIMFM